MISYPHVSRTDAMYCSRYLGGVLLSAGSDTTASYIQSFILALIVYPEMQKKAQQEMDRIVGSDRAPELADFEHLPFLQACVKEVCSKLSI